jgi:hypothetical protein
MDFNAVSSQSEPAELGALWIKAVNDYIKKTGKSIEHLRAKSMDSVLVATAKENEGIWWTTSGRR